MTKKKIADRESGANRQTRLKSIPASNAQVDYEPLTPDQLGEVSGNGGLYFCPLFPPRRRIDNDGLIDVIVWETGGTPGSG